jgi:hypothetical protein
VAVRIERRVAQNRRHSILKPFGNEMLQAFCFLVYLVPRVFEDIVQKKFQ